jgi:hypothetical protein
MDWVTSMLVESIILVILTSLTLSTEKTKKQKELYFLLKIPLWAGIIAIIIAVIILLIRLTKYISS